MRQSYEGVPITQSKNNENQIEEQKDNDKYFTLSKKGMTTFVNDEPVEFTKIEDWLAERAQFSQISQKKFFKKFRSWKILRMWRRNIVAARREDATSNLRGKLFAADGVFGPILLKHRRACKELEELKVVEVPAGNREPFAIDEFRDWQRVAREKVHDKIRDTSDESRAWFKSGINEILDKLREKISKQDEADQNDEIAGKLDNMQYNQNQLKN